MHGFPEFTFVLVVLGLFVQISTSEAQRPPQVISPEMMDDQSVIFRIHAPNANAVKLGGSDIPDYEQGAEMKKNSDGVWSVKISPIKSGAYRYHFNVDGVSVIDPNNPATSESNMNTYSLVYVPGATFTDTNDVPHGAISTVMYQSSSLNRQRRLHVYTPPGYESGEGTFPIFYLLHGASDSDNSWSTVGRAGFILDNLIAEGKAKPMVVVMPAGHTAPFIWGMPLPLDEFVEDFNTDIKPFVEKRYRILPGRKNRAIAGLSMGGAHTLEIGIPHLDKYAYLGVYSSGVFGINDDSSWETKHLKVLDDAKLKDGLELFWFATGKDDFLLETSRSTVKMLEKHKFDVVYEETEGGHTWINWRDYLNKFVSMLFQ